LIDRIASDQLAENLLHFIAGQTTNFDFDRQAISTTDAAVLAIFDSVWCFYDDFSKHRLRGEGYWLMIQKSKWLAGYCFFILMPNISGQKYALLAYAR